jgi:hypothetical protein
MTQAGMSRDTKIQNALWYAIQGAGEIAFGLVVKIIDEKSFIFIRMYRRKSRMLIGALGTRYILVISWINRKIANNPESGNLCGGYVGFMKRD